MFSLSPLDGRYNSKVSKFSRIFSEFGLMKYRTRVECEWLKFLSAEKFFELKKENLAMLNNLISDFSEQDFAKIKKIEETTNHDVKAVELFIREKLPQNIWAWIHFGCTSEDINSTSYALMLNEGKQVLSEEFARILADVKSKSANWKKVAMLSRTHGQTATPTTVGKEFANFFARFSSILNKLKNLECKAKFSGATGNYAAHTVAFPEKDWSTLSRNFLQNSLKLIQNPLTTQIEPHDTQAEILNYVSQFATIGIDFCRDIWGYISLGYFGQKVVAGETGSSTMPHKVNPIDFENAEGNFTLARGIARTLTDSLPISRWQRDLTDSTLQRNFGLVFGHALLATKSLLKGLGKLELSLDKISQDLKNAPEVLTEAIQTVMRAEGHHNAYEQLKTFSRGKPLTEKQICEFIEKIEISDKSRLRLQKLTPELYTGLSEKLVDENLK